MSPGRHASARDGCKCPGRVQVPGTGASVDRHCSKRTRPTDMDRHCSTERGQTDWRMGMDGMGMDRHWCAGTGTGTKRHKSGVPWTGTRTLGHWTRDIGQGTLDRHRDRHKTRQVGDCMQCAQDGHEATDPVGSAGLSVPWIGTKIRTRSDRPGCGIGYPANDSRLSARCTVRYCCTDHRRNSRRAERGQALDCRRHWTGTKIRTQSDRPGRGIGFAG